MNISLTPELEKFVKAEVKDGLYQTASEVVRAALRRLKEDKSHTVTPRTIEELEASLIASLDRLDRGEGVGVEEAFRRLRRKINKHTSRG